MGKTIHKIIGAVLFVGCEALITMLFGIRGLLLAIAASCVSASLAVLLIDEQSLGWGDGENDLKDDDTTEGR